MVQGEFGTVFFAELKMVASVRYAPAAVDLWSRPEMVEPRFDLFLCDLG